VTLALIAYRTNGISNASRLNKTSAARTGRKVPAAAAECEMTMSSRVMSGACARERLLSERGHCMKASGTFNYKALEAQVASMDPPQKCVNVSSHAHDPTLNRIR